MADQQSLRDELSDKIS